MKTLFNKLNKFGVLAILFAALLITTQSAFKSAAKLTQPADGWFEVAVIDLGESHTDPNNLDIMGRISEPDEVNDEGCAQSGNSGDLCAVYLEFTTAAFEVPNKVSDVNPTYSSIDGDAQQP